MARTPEMLATVPLRHNPTGQGLILSAMGMLALGVVLVYSAAASVGSLPPWYARREVRHAIFALLACGVLLFGWRFNYRRLMWGRRVPVIPAVMLGISLVAAALVFVHGIGRSVGGFYRWIRLGPAEYSIGFQPSELVKIALMIFLVAWLSRDSADVRSWKTFVTAVAIIGACAAAVVTQDFGAAAVICIAAGATMLLAGVPILYLLGLLLPAAGGVYMFVMRVPHRMARITAMMDVWSQGNPTSYQPRQALIAILSGGWTGKGPGAGTQKMFLPENTTDFIFSAYCEEWGFVGAMLLIGLIALWAWHWRRAAVRAPDGFGRLLAGSLGFLIAMQAVLHVAVNLVVAPPTGISFPFVSAGGTALITTAVAAALMVSVTARRGK
jgi:cell division protein FtsW